MIDNGPLKSKSKYGDGFGLNGKKRKGGLPTLQRPSEVVKVKGRAPRQGKPGIVGAGVSGLVTGASKYAPSAQRQAAVSSELAKLNANKNLTAAQKGHRSALLAEQGGGNRQAAVNSEINRLNSKPITRKQDKGHLANLRKEKAKRGWA